jgi:hypothetical protein
MNILYCCALAAVLLGCSSCGAATQETAPTPSAGPSYEVHEWGLVQGTSNDGVMLSGPFAQPAPMPVAKPVLYFHRSGEGPLRVDVEARIANGRIVEHWPTPGGDPGTRAAWQGVEITNSNCHGSRYPSQREDPCSRLNDGCEAATLASVETDDSSCAAWPDAEHRYNHLFYRGEVSGAPPLPLALEPRPDGSLRVTSRSRDPIPGRLVRIVRSNNMPGVIDAVIVVAPPPPGQSIVVSAPTAPLASGLDAVTESLRAAGMTDAEIAAFHRAWDGPIFGATGATAESPVTATPIIARPLAPSRSVLYVLPASSADQLATLSFTPPPTAVRRAIAAWVEEIAN